MHELVKRLLEVDGVLTMKLKIPELEKCVEGWLEEKCKSWCGSDAYMKDMGEHFGLSKKEWCEHMAPYRAIPVPTIHFDPVYKWFFCPICGTKRPDCGSSLGEV